MTEAEYWAAAEEDRVLNMEKDRGDVRLVGLSDEGGWKEMRSSLPDVGPNHGRNWY
jgi:hypothetical protein